MTVGLVLLFYQKPIEGMPSTGFDIFGQGGIENAKYFRSWKNSYDPESATCLSIRQAVL